MVNESWKGTALFVAMPERNQIEIKTTNLTTKKAAPNRKIGLS